MMVSASTIRHAAAAAFLAMVSGPALAGCGDDPAPCAISGGTYHTMLPEGLDAGDPPPPALVFLHGWGGSGDGTFKMRAMVKAFLDKGYAVIAPDGQPRSGDRGGRTWAVVPAMRGARDDAGFVVDVADDAATRFHLDRKRMVLAGFSLGGSMTTYVACRTPGAFAAFAPVAGSFWNPLPQDCAGPTRLFHTHGRADGTVPMAGRRLRIGLEQGDVLKSLDILAALDGCAPGAEPLPKREIYDRTRWTGCKPGASLDLALHPGGHGVPKGWADMVLDWLAAG